MLFKGRNQVPFWYSIYNCKRSTGYHRGIDIVGLDDKNIMCPVDGIVRTATIITNKADLTWEWGYYVRVDEANGNKHYFAHCAKDSFYVKAGQKVKKGDLLARMSNTGNAALANPPIEHVHYEVRTPANVYLYPCDYAGVKNEVGIY